MAEFQYFPWMDWVALGVALILVGGMVYTQPLLHDAVFSQEDERISIEVVGEELEIYVGEDCNDSREVAVSSLSVENDSIFMRWHYQARGNETYFCGLFLSVDVISDSNWRADMYLYSDQELFVIKETEVQSTAGNEVHYTVNDRDESLWHWTSELVFEVQMYQE